MKPLAAKPPEEGRIWEWRAFGRVTSTLEGRLRAFPPRPSATDIEGEDIYLVSDISNQNVKLRMYASGSVLKFKLLFATGPEGIELYNESASYVHRFPVGAGELKEAARLLDVHFTESQPGDSLLDPEEFIVALSECSPPVVTVEVKKRRSQFVFEGGWLELADVMIADYAVQSVSIQSPDYAAVEEMLRRLHPGRELETMNYVEACRRWR